MTDAAESTPAVDGNLLEMARDLVVRLEEGDEQGTTELLGVMTRAHETSLYRQIGKLTRQLHEFINSFHLELQVVALADKEIPDARERLNRVIALTKQVADRTLGAVEVCLPLVDALPVRIRNLVDALPAMDEGHAHLTWCMGTAASLRRELEEILLTQEFQDLTGQVIRRVIGLVQEIETSLVALIRVSGQSSRPSTGADSERKTQSTGFGPSIAGVDDDGQRVESQDEVDDLIASLGF